MKKLLVVTALFSMSHVACFWYPEKASGSRCKAIRYPQDRYGISPTELRKFEAFKQKCEEAGYRPKIIR